MGKLLDIEQLKTLLRHEVALLCQHDDRKWKQPISGTIDEIRARNWPAVFFGGTLRSLLISRLARNKLGRPRDIDIVVRGVSPAELEGQFREYISRETRFGGFQLRRVNWQFDLWPLDRTFGLLQDQGSQPEFLNLPNSTFLNVEAIAVEVWPQRGRPRVVYSGDDQFFRGILSRTIEINREQNPFPELCVVRALVMAGNLQWKSRNLPWKIGHKLLHYLEKHGGEMSENDFVDVQRKHYGQIQWSGVQFKRILDHVSLKLATGIKDPVELPLPKQMRLWESEDEHWPRIKVCLVGQKNLNRPQQKWPNEKSQNGR